MRADHYILPLHPVLSVFQHCEQEKRCVDLSSGNRGKKVGRLIEDNRGRGATIAFEGLSKFECKHVIYWME